MTINTKYNIGQAVWFIENLQIKMAEITEISTGLPPDMYRVNGKWKFPYELFLTKQELLKSLE